MPGVPHPRGPEYGALYPTPEEARASTEEHVWTIPFKDFLEALENSKTQTVLATAHRLNQSDIEFMKEAAPNLMVINHHLVRRAGMYAIDSGKCVQSELK